MENFAIQIYKNNKIDYDQIRQENVFVINDQEELFDISFIITARNRLDFSEPMYRSFKEACKKTDLKISYTVVEHSDAPMHSKFCKNNQINYIWINAKGLPFNKCLSYNCGAIFSVKSKYILFHDIDCVLQSNFFELLKENIAKKKAKGIQCFTERRVLYCSEIITRQLINKEIEFDQLKLDNINICTPMFFGAPGGSILVDRSLFFDVGGYDAEIFDSYAPEDAFFWDKIDLIDKMYICDDPNIEIYHMHHEPMYNKNPKLKEMSMFYEEYKKLDREEKIKYIDSAKDGIKKFR